ncbi:ATP synthase subunit C [Angelakisella massiliensis]|uniref:ATP synthase subunit C n=1 Tax=Angelakisella massiliensis TaxID=1871018 RepID=UPI0008F961F5|nr:ATP synthase subunit C [Angelakisella massiliensis]
MNILTLFLLPLAVVALLAMPLVPVYRGITTGRKAKHAVVFNLCAFFGVAALMMILPIGNVVALAAEEAAVAEVISTGAGMGYLAAALVTGLSCIGAGIAVAAAAPAAIGAFSENSKNFGKALIFVALGEGVALYGLLISILIINSL